MKRPCLRKALTALFLPFVLVIVALATSAAPGRADASSAKNTPDNAQDREVDMHAPHVRYHFNDTDMDFTFGSLVLGATGNQGCEIGEAFATAAKIKDGDAASWQAAWLDAAAKARTRGEKSLAGGHSQSARVFLSRAANYYRFATCAMLPDDPRLARTARKSRETMIQAGKLYDPPLEYFEIPFEGTVLPGFFRKAAHDRTPRKTLIMLGGGETFAEDLVFYIMPQAFERGYNFVTVDLPGQGMLPLAGKVFRPNMYVPAKALVDSVVARPDVDKNRLGLYGISGGGGFAPQTAQHDPRIKALAMNSCVVDAHALFAAMTPVTTATPEKVKTWSSFHANTVKAIAWRWGVSGDNIPGLVEANRGFCFDPSRVAVPALILVGEGEYKSAEVKRQQKLCLEGLANATMVVTPLDEGASNHCMMENRSMVGQALFDWMDTVFKETADRQARPGNGDQPGR